MNIKNYSEYEVYISILNGLVTGFETYGIKVIKQMKKDCEYLINNPEQRPNWGIHIELHIMDLFKIWYLFEDELIPYITLEDIIRFKHELLPNCGN